MIRISAIIPEKGRETSVRKTAKMEFSDSAKIPVRSKKKCGRRIDYARGRFGDYNVRYISPTDIGENEISLRGESFRIGRIDLFQVLGLLRKSGVAPPE